MNRMRPLIGITTSVNSQDYETSDQSVVMIPENYPKAVEKAGGIPLLISDCGDPNELLDVIDGLIISGGRDINPRLYGDLLHEETIDVNDRQDEWEVSLIEGAIEREICLYFVYAEDINYFVQSEVVNYSNIFPQLEDLRSTGKLVENGLIIR